MSDLSWEQRQWLYAKNFVRRLATKTEDERVPVRKSEMEMNRYVNIVDPKSSLDNIPIPPLPWRVYEIWPSEELFNAMVQYGTNVHFSDGDGHLYTVPILCRLFKYKEIPREAKFIQELTEKLVEHKDEGWCKELMEKYCQ